MRLLPRLSLTGELDALPLAAITQSPALDVLNTKPWNWLGLISRKPITEDYVPLLPWLGVVLWGLAAGQWLLARRRSVLAGQVSGALRPLAALGRWSLSFYMLHQPLLIGAILAWRWAVR